MCERGATALLKQQAGEFNGGKGPACADDDQQATLGLIEEFSQRGNIKVGCPFEASRQQFQFVDEWFSHRGFVRRVDWPCRNARRVPPRNGTTNYDGVTILCPEQRGDNASLRG